MKHNQEISYSLKIDFQKHSENPSRIFISMGNMIDSFKSIDLLLANSIDTSMSFNQYLGDIEVSSLISRIVESITYHEQPQLGQLPSEEDVREYFDKSKSTIIETINSHKKIKDLKTIESLDEKLEVIAEETNIKKTLLYIPRNKITLARNLEQLTNSTKLLKDTDNITYQSGDKSEFLNKDCIVELDEIEDLVTDEKIDQIVKMVLKIKKPDYLGDSKWEFRRGKHPVLGKIIHEDWLKRFKEGEVITKPGDSLLANVREVIKYDKNGNIVSEHYEIVEVLKINQKSANDNMTFNED